MAYPRFSKMNIRLEIHWNTDDPDIPVDVEYPTIGFNTLKVKNAIRAVDDGYEINDAEMTNYLKAWVNRQYLTRDTEYEVKYRILETT